MHPPDTPDLSRLQEQPDDSAIEVSVDGVGDVILMKANRYKEEPDVILVSREYPRSKGCAKAELVRSV